MKELLIYQLEVACCLSLFFLFYRVILRKETNFQLKRLFIILSSLMAFVLPALNIQYSLKTGETPIPFEYLTMIPAQIIAYSPSSIPSNETDLWIVFSLVWGIGFSIMVLRLLFSLYHVNKILKEATKEPKGQTFKITNTKVQSFSFFKTIVLNARHYQSKALKYILAHEQAHSDQYHSVDVLLVELLKSIQWFNPIAWLFAKEALQNLEYLADREVMTSQDNAQEYQMAIVQYSHHSGSKLLRSEFSKSNLKNRIIMMNQPNNQKIHLGKFLLFIPIIGALFISFSMKIENLDLRKEVSEILPIFNIQESNINKPLNIFSIDKLPVVHRKNNEPVSKLDTVKTLEDKLFTIADEQPYPSTGDMGSYFEKIHAELNYPLEAKEKGIKGKVFVQFIVQKDGTLREVMAVKGIGYGCDEEAVRIIKNGPLWDPGKDKGKNVDVRMILPITFSNDDHADTRNLSGTVLSESGEPVIGCNVIIKGTQIGTVSDREGRFSIKIKPEHAELVFAYIGMESQTINIADEKDYKIIMKIDEGYVAPTKSEGNGISISVRGLEFMSENDRPMFILNGVEIQHEDFILIQPVDIESITVLKDHNAIDKYGEGAKNGVIIIKTKNSIKLRTNKILSFDKDNPPLIYKDGVEISLEEAEKINPKTVESISVTKGDSVKEKYGEKGKNGVVIIKMKE